jgi:hypothetical protein
LRIRDNSLGIYLLAGLTAQLPVTKAAEKQTKLKNSTNTQEKTLNKTRLVW